MIDSSVMQKMPTRIWFLSLAGAVGAAAILKIGLLSSGSVPFNSDEAIVALMAKHILQGERPFFFYGQAYMGSLDAYLIAAVFKLFGEYVWGVRLVQIILYTLTLITTAILGKQLTGQWKVGVLAVWLLAIPSINTTLYTTVSLGGYGEMLVIGNLILMTTLNIHRSRLRNKSKQSIFQWFALGFLSGFGLWVFGLTLVYSISAFIYLAWILTWSRQTENQSIDSESSHGILSSSFPGNREIVVAKQAKLWSVALIGIAIGAIPWWAYAQNAGTTKLLIELGGGAISGVESLNLVGQFFQHLLNLVLFGSSVMLGLRPPWGILWLALPLAPFILIFWGGVVFYAIKKTKSELNLSPINQNYSHAPLLTGVIATVFFGFILSPFGADPSGRYFLPVAVVMALFASQAVWSWHEKWGKFVWIIVGSLLLFNFWGTLQVVQADHPGITTQFDAVTQIDHRYDQELIDFLKQNGEYRGFTNYWVSYPLAFHSDEQLVFIPRLPYHQDLRYTRRDDRYKPYELIVQQSEQTAFITTTNPNLDRRIREGFTSKGLDWQEARIGDYLIYYNLSEKVYPDEIGFGDIGE
jgi:hypothetical protein